MFHRFALRFGAVDPPVGIPLIAVFPKGGFVPMDHPRADPDNRSPPEMLPADFCPFRGNDPLQRQSERRVDPPSFLDDSVQVREITAFFPSDQL